MSSYAKILKKELPVLLVLFALPMSPGALGAIGNDEEREAGRTLLIEDFDGDPETGLAKALLAHRHIRLAEGMGPDGSDAIRVAYVGFEAGSERVVVRYPIDAPVERATLSFDVCFEEDFQWTRGGKLHGLGPRRVISGGQPRQPEGWSARVVFSVDGRCSSYLYDQAQDRKYGTTQTTDEPVFQKGRWHRVVLQVGLNEPGQEDGHARILIDGQPVIHAERVEFRGEGGPDTLIRNFVFSTFHGGSNSRWTPLDDEGNPTTVHALFDNFQVTEGFRTEAEEGAGGSNR